MAAVHQTGVWWWLRRDMLSILRFPLLLYQDCRSVWPRFFLILIWFWPNLVEFLFSPPCPGGRIDQPKLNTPIPQVMLWHSRGLEGRKGELRRRKQTVDCFFSPCLCQTPRTGLTYQPRHVPRLCWTLFSRIHLGPCTLPQNWLL